MSGVSPNHVAIEMNLTEILNPAAGKCNCRAFGAKLIMKVPNLTIKIITLDFDLNVNEINQGVVFAACAETANQ